MSSRQALVSAVLGSCFLTIGCVGATDSDAFLDVDAPALEVQGGFESTNGLLPEYLWNIDNLDALAQLATAALLGPGKVLVPTDLTATAGGMAVLSYTLRCALPAEEAIEGPNGEKLVGELGLAPKWLDGPLDAKGQRWMTACIIQHLNGLGLHVPIMLEGTHSALAPQPWADTSAFTVKESTMGGNLFLPPNPADPIVVWACTEKHMEDACGGDADYWLSQRICGSSPACGLGLLGPCDHAPTCFEDKYGFWECEGDIETIRSSLMPGTADVMYEQCNAF